jgi:hypothetical protein
MARKKIITINDVFAYLAWIPYINLGGCGISALAIYRWLEKENLLIKNPISKGQNTRFVFLYEGNGKHIFDNNKEAIKDINTEPIAPNHAVLFHDGNYIDVDGIIDVSTYKWMQNISNEDFIIRANNTVDYWNPSFDRNKYLRLIEKRLGIDLSDIALRERYPWQLEGIVCRPTRIMKRIS